MRLSIFLDDSFQGYTGSQGPLGYSGSRGFTGFTGSRGYVGSSGVTFKILGVLEDANSLPEINEAVQGDAYVVDDNLFVSNTIEWVDVGPFRGYAGSRGIQGELGYTGSRAYTGSRGFVGSQGIEGAIGAQGWIGSTGYVGSQGALGYTGSTGYVGSQGFAGSRGLVGFVGSQGWTGSRGFTGSYGPIGYTGSRGLTGFVGSQGFRGFVGSGGADGTSVIILGSKDDPSELPPTDNNTGDGYIIGDNLWLWDGEEWTNVGQIRGPTGYTGSLGTRGWTGSLGLRGYSGSRGVVGFAGSLGARGITGWTGSLGLRGFTGFTGSRGTNGFDGSRGFRGWSGSRGSIGYSGSQGLRGYTGSVGSIGYTGSRGTTGFSGSRGFVGSKGAIGFSGSRGFAGSQGAIGFSGSRGFAGSQGAVGFSGSKGYVGSQGDANPVLWAIMIGNNGGTTYGYKKDAYGICFNQRVIGDLVFDSFLAVSPNNIRFSVVNSESENMQIPTVSSINTTMRDISGNNISVTMLWDENNFYYQAVDSVAYSWMSTRQNYMVNITNLNVDYAIATLNILGSVDNSMSAGSTYTSTISAVGGLEPYTYSLVGTWPTGLSLNASTGVVSGTPTTAGTYSNLSVRVTDSFGGTADLATFSITVAPEVSLSITGTPVTTSEKDKAYTNFTVTADGGQTPYTYSLVGTWPPGLSINSSTGVVSGTPTTAGTYNNLSVRVTDSLSATTDLATFSITVSTATSGLIGYASAQASDPIIPDHEIGDWIIAVSVFTGPHGNTAPVATANTNNPWELWDSIVSGTDRAASVYKLEATRTDHTITWSVGNGYRPVWVYRGVEPDIIELRTYINNSTVIFPEL